MFLIVVSVVSVEVVEVVEMVEVAEVIEVVEVIMVGMVIVDDIVCMLVESSPSFYLGIEGQTIVLNNC